MIKLDSRLFSEMLEFFNLEPLVKEYSLITNTQKPKNGIPRVRIIADVKTQTGEQFIIKVVKEEEHPPDLIQKQSEFSETLRENGIPVPKRHQLPCGCYCPVLSLSGVACAVTIEDREGDKDLAFINERYVSRLAELMAEMHRISEKFCCRIGNGTIWDLFNPLTDISRGWNRFLTLPEAFAFEGKTRQLYAEIIQRQLHKRDEHYKVWAGLPQFAVQGDFSTNNVMLMSDGSVRALIDFNIAGDERLVNDLVTQGIFICYIMDLEPGLQDNVRGELLSLFVSTYLAKCRLSQVEEAILNPLYQCVFPFLWTTIELLEENLESGRTDKVIKLLEEMLQETERPLINL